MFSSMFQSLMHISKKQNKDLDNASNKKAIEVSQLNVDNVLTLLNEIKEESANDFIGSLVSTNSKESLVNTSNKKAIEVSQLNVDNVLTLLNEIKEESNNDFIGSLVSTNSKESLVNTSNKKAIEVSQLNVDNVLTLLNEIKEESNNDFIGSLVSTNSKESLVNTSNKKAIEVSQLNVDNVLTLLNEIKEESNNDFIGSLVSTNSKESLVNTSNKKAIEVSQLNVDNVLTLLNEIKEESNNDFIGSLVSTNSKESLVNTSNKKAIEVSQLNVDNVLTLLNEIKEESNNDFIGSLVSTNSKESLVNTHLKELPSKCNLVGNVKDAKRINNSIGENMRVSVEDKKKNIFNQVESLHCIFTWKLKSLKEQNIIKHIKKKYGHNNLDISLPEFTFIRFIGNLIISYELYQNGELDASNMKILEIGDWLEKLDKYSDEFYLSINVGLKHIRMANFVHMFYAENETGGLKWLLDEIVPFENMNNKAKAAVFAIRAAILIEYGDNLDCFKNACKYAKKACELDCETPHWFHIYLLMLTSQRQFVRTQKLYATEKQFFHINEMDPIENEINLTVQQIVNSLNGKSNFSIYSHVFTGLNQYLEYENEIAQSRLPVLKTDNSDKIFLLNTNYCEQKVVPNLEEDIKIIVEKHKNGENAVPYLTVLISKYNEYDKWKIMVQICSYTILFTNNFRTGIEQFSVLIEEPGICTSDLISHHKSSFINGSKKFNLAVLICNEIQLATKLLNRSSTENILCYYKIFFKIKKVCRVKIKSVDPSMRVALIGDSSAVFTCSNTTYKNEINFLNEKVVNISENIKISKNILTNSYQQYNFKNITNHNSCANFANNENFNYFQQYQSSKSIPSILDLKLNLNFQSTIYTNTIITTNITSSPTNIDTSLSKLSRGSTTPRTYKACLKNILQNHPNSFRIYTDASKIQDNVGIAIVSNKDIYSYKLSSEYTSCDAEAVAILRALDYALLENFNDYIILSDSLNTITCIQNLNIASDVINSILCLIHAHQLKGNLMHFIWIPSHNEIEGNEIADKLAKQIATSNTAITYSHNSFMTNNLRYKFL